MYDAIEVANLPAGGDAYAGYVGGSWPTYKAVCSRFPGVPVLSIAVNAQEDADCLDMERGDASLTDFPVWQERQRRRGVTRPCGYTSQANLGTFKLVLAQASIVRTSVRAWSAHYTGSKPHICSPTSCNAAMVCDGTQWASNDRYDTSQLVDSFFSLPHVHPSPTATEEPDMLVIANHGKPTLLVAGGQVIRLDDGPDVDYWVKAGAKVLRGIPADSFAKFWAHAV